MVVGSSQPASRHRRFRPAKLNLWITSLISAQIWPDDLSPHDRLVDSELAIQLLDVLWFGGDVDHRVDALGLLPDFVRQPPAAPDVDVVDRPTTLGDYFQVPVERGLNRTLLGIRVEDDHDLVLTHALPHLLWSKRL